MHITETNKTITVGGKEYKLSPLTIEQLAEVQQWVYDHTDDPITVAGEVIRELPEDYPPEVKTAVSKEILATAYAAVTRGARRLGSDEANNALGTLEGTIYQLYQQGRKHQPDMTVADWETVFVQLVEEETESVKRKALEEVGKALQEQHGGAIPDPKAPSSATVRDDHKISVGVSPHSPKRSGGRRKKSGD